MTEIIGMPEFTVYQNDTNGYSVIKYIAEDGKRFTAVGSFIPDCKEVTVKLTGEWEIGHHGRQFHVTEFEIVLPTNRNGVVRYLASLKAGIGTKNAEKIYTAFGESTWDVLEKNPERLVALKGFSEKKVKKLRQKLAETSVTRSLVKVLGNHITLTPKKIEAITYALGLGAASIIESDPYSLLEVSGFGFSEVDRFAIKKGASPSDERRLLAGISHTLSALSSQGNTCVPRETLEKMLPRTLSTSNYTLTSQIAASIVDKAILTEKVIEEKNLIYTPGSYRRENTIARQLRLKNLPSNYFNELAIRSAISEFCRKENIEMSASQKDAVLKAFAKCVCVITGGPGTGKTTITKCILYVYKKLVDNGRPMLLAPTGRAARRMAEVTGYPAQTVHSAVGYRAGASDEDYVPIEADFVIVDEASMLDQFITAMLLCAVPLSATIIFVGDADQLPSVGAGNVFADLINSNALLVSRLTDIFRQGADNLIIPNSQKILQGDTNIQFGKQFKMFETSDTLQTLSQACGLYISCVRAYGIENVALLCPYRCKSSINTNILNKNLQHYLNPKRDGEKTISVNSTEFRKGDRIMQTKNTDAAMNGDTGFITDIVYKILSDDDVPTLCAEIEFNADGTKHYYDKNALEDVSLAYAMTVHKSQGSEYKTVLYVASNEHSALAQRNLFYTAVTRSSANFAIVGEFEAVKTCIKNTYLKKRYTYLAERLQPTHSLLNLEGAVVNA